MKGLKVAAFVIQEENYFLKNLWFVFKHLCLWKKGFLLFTWIEAEQHEYVIGLLVVIFSRNVSQSERSVDKYLTSTHMNILLIEQYF